MIFHSFFLTKLEIIHHMIHITREKKNQRKKLAMF